MLPVIDRIICWVIAFPAYFVLFDYLLVFMCMFVNSFIHDHVPPLSCTAAEPSVYMCVRVYLYAHVLINRTLYYVYHSSHLIRMIHFRATLYCAVPYRAVLDRQLPISDFRFSKSQVPSENAIHPRCNKISYRDFAME